METNEIKNINQLQELVTTLRPSKQKKDLYEAEIEVEGKGLCW